MKIPADAIIPRDKITHYLLVWRRKGDKSKFLAQAGFNLDNPGELEAAIRKIIEENEASFQNRNKYGDYFQVEGDLIGPNKRILEVVTIWIVKVHADGKFQFVTLKPRK